MVKKKFNLLWIIIFIFFQLTPLRAGDSVPFLSTVPSPAQLADTYKTYRENAAQGISATYDQLEKFVLGANNACGDPSYAKANRTLCTSLRDDLNKVVYNPIPESAAQVEKALQTTDPETAVAALDAIKAEAESLTSQITQQCSAPIPPENETLCYNLSHQFEMASGYLEGLLNHIQSFQEFSSECIHKLYDYKVVETVTETYQELIETAPQCTPEMAKRASDECLRDLMCTSAASTLSVLSLLGDAYYGIVGYDAATAPTSKCISSENSCLMQLVKGIVDSVWGLITGLWDLIVTQAGGYVWQKGVDAYHWLAGVEDTSAQSVEAASYFTDEDWEKLTSDPAGFAMEKTGQLVGGIYSAMADYMSNSLYCQEWSGVPKVSTCVRPWTGFACMECGTYITGTCAAIGVVAAELVPMFFSGGLYSFGKWTAKGVSGIAKAVGASGRIAKYAEEISVATKGLRAAAEGTEAYRTLTRVSKVARTYTRYTRAQLSKIAEAAKLTTEGLTKSRVFTAAQAIAKTVAGTPPVRLIKFAGKSIEEIHLAAFRTGEGIVDLTYGRGVATGLHIIEKGGIGGTGLLSVEGVSQAIGALSERLNNAAIDFLGTNRQGHVSDLPPISNSGMPNARPPKVSINPGLPEDQYLAIKRYTGGSYKQINEELRAGRLTEATAQEVERIERGLEQIPAYQGTTYRGTKMPEDSLRKYREAYENNRPVVEDTFLSTSKDPNAPDAFNYAAPDELAMGIRPVKMTIKGESGRDVTMITTWSREDEILFPPGKKFKVTKYNDAVDPIEIELEEIVDGALPRAQVVTGRIPVAAVDGDLNLTDVQRFYKDVGSYPPDPVKSQVLSAEYQRVVISPETRQITSVKTASGETINLSPNSKIGEGNSAVVFASEDGKAIKVARKPEGVAKLAIEADIASDLSSKQAKYGIRVIQPENYTRGDPFLVKPRLDSTQLGDQIASRGLSPIQKTKLEELWRGASQYARDTGIGLDLKAANLFWDEKLSDWVLFDTGPRMAYTPYGFTADLDTFDQYLETWNEFDPIFRAKYRLGDLGQ